jgi:hypothetical protein
LLLEGFEGLKINASGIAMQLVVARFSQKGSQNAQHFCNPLPLALLCNWSLQGSPKRDQQR